jgi:hypothetical protein
LSANYTVPGALKYHSNIAIFKKGCYSPRGHFRGENEKCFEREGLDKVKVTRMKEIGSVDARLDNAVRLGGIQQHVLLAALKGRRLMLSNFI